MNDTHNAELIGTPAVSQPAPPSHLQDPYVCRVGVERALWTKQIRQWGMPRPVQLVGHTLASYGNKDGTRCFPGMERLAQELDYSTRTVERHLAWLLEHGWIELVSRGARKLGEANHYRLTMPAPIAANLVVRLRGKHRGWLWPVEAGEQWMERPHGAPGTINPKASRSSRGQFLPDNQRRSTRHLAAVVPDTCVGTPGSYQGVPHHSERSLGPTLPRGGESGPPDWFNDPLPDEPDDDLINEVAERVTDEVDYPGAWGLSENMLGNGFHPQAIINTARKRAAS